MDNINELTCPCCGGSLKYNIAEGNIKCPYCDSEFSIEEIKGQAEEKAQDFQDETNWNTKDSMNEFDNDEIASMNSYCCEMCGGEIIADENTASTSCPYCGNNVLIKSRLTGALKPRYIIPFMKTTDDAKLAFKKYLNGKVLLPKVFKSQNKLNEVKPLYVPYWLYDADVEARIKYTGTKVRKYKKGDYEYTEISYYSIVRDGEIAYEHLPIDASKSIDNKYTEAIEPYYFQDAKEFEPGYLAGYMSDKYDVTADEASVRATERIKQGTESAFRDTIHGYKDVSLDSCNIKLSKTSADYALYPVYLLNSKWNDNNYKFAMNGETGLIKGDLPMSKLKYILWFFGLFIGFAALLTLFIWACSIEDGQGELGIALILGIPLGLLISFLITKRFKKQLKGAVLQYGSSQYYKDNSLKFYIKSDRFMYKKVEKRKIQSSSSSSKK